MDGIGDVDMTNSSAILFESHWRQKKIEQAATVFFFCAIDTSKAETDSVYPVTVWYLRFRIQIGFKARVYFTGAGADKLSFTPYASFRQYDEPSLMIAD